MRKGGLCKPLILDKYSAEDLDTGAKRTRTQGAKHETCKCVLHRPAISREPAGQDLSTRCEGKSSKSSCNSNRESREYEKTRKENSND